MHYRGKISLKHVFIYLIAMIALMFLLPWLCIRIFPELGPLSPDPAYDGQLPETVRLYITSEEKYRTVDFEEYVAGVVASEMPASFDREALKAQAVASRTYALGRILAGSSLCDSVHCQVYRDHDISQKVKKAVEDTCGQVLLYKGSLAAHALYFSSSGGRTENSQDVFSGTYAYLVSVDSSYEPGATHKRETLTLSLSRLSKKLAKAMPDLDFGKITTGNIKVISRSEGGRAALIRIGSQTISGAELRSALNLYSTRISFSFKGDQVTITTSGSGHGVGMSQYGANGLAKKGMKYREILAHYYQGTKVSRKN